MLQLLKLEAYGFKSFADKLNIEFGRGVTAIVGPNGSGKSNITDAIRWALGEQNIRNLRGAKSEDIIFSGSSERRRLGVAEVSLIFDNSSGQLPLEFQEVIVTRRIFRSGESEYYINKTPCRLKDIHALFADTGLGRDAMSVISQNKVDYVLNSKPEDRRELFEEAAGITRYRNRKRDAMYKLEETEKNQLRVGDIILEIEGNMENLAAAAAKTRRYNELNRKYEQAKVTLLLNKFDKYDSLLNDSRREKKKLTEELAAHKAALNNTDVSRSRIAAELQEVERSLQLLAVKNRQFSGELEKNGSRLAVLEEKLRQSELDKARLTAVLVESASKEQQAQTRLAENESRAAHIDMKLAHTRTQLAKVTSRLQEIDDKLESAKAALAKCQAEQFSQIRKNMQLEAAVGAHQTAVQNLQQSLVEQAREQAAIEQDASICQNECARLQEQLADEQMQLASLAHKLKTLQSARTAKITAQNELTGKLNNTRQQLADAQNKVKFLQNLQAEYEGFGKAVKAVLKAKMSWQQGICGAVAELIHVPAEYITAVEVALGGALQNIVTADDYTAKQAIIYLKQNRLGRATFLPLNTIQQNTAVPADRLTGYDGFIGYAVDLIEFEPKYRSVMEFIFRRTLIVHNIDDAMAIARAEKYKVRLVTLEGELVNPGGSFTGGSIVRREASFFSRAEEITVFSRQITAAQTKLVELQATEINVAGEIDGLIKKLDKVQTEYNQVEVAVAEGRLRFGQAQREYGLKMAALEEQSVKLITLTDRINEEQAKLVAVQRQLEEAQHKSAAVEEAELEQTLAAGQVERSEISARQTDFKIKLSALEQEKNYLTEKRASDELALQECRRQKETAQKELKDGHSRQVKYEQTAAELAVENKRLKDLRAIGERDYTNFQTVRLDKIAEAQRLDKKMQEMRQAGGVLDSRLHQQELDIAKYTLITEQCSDEMVASYKLTVEEARAGRSDGNQESLLQASLELEKEMAALGSVNPNAVAEYEAVNERYQFLKTQADDLIRSREYLTGIISEIDATMAKQFKAAFAEIKEYFLAIFTKLFGGGAAELKLTGGENVLEAGIDIIVQPPGKKMNGLAVLSGGERALTVISLLFALLKYKPAPFTVVDEIDAPLDEANVDRFGKFLREYSLNTQFIVVTHRKGTMQAADALYGVTASTAGVSRLISVKLEDIDE